MTLQRREKILASVAGGLLAVAALWFLAYGGDGRSLDQLRAERDRLMSDVQTKEGLPAPAARDAARLAEWRRRALPTDAAVARSLYQNWLRSLATRFRFRQLSVESKEAETRRDMFTRLAFAVRGQVELADLTRFLHEFYAAGHFHQIRFLDVKPRENSKELDVNLRIEALSLPEADRRDQLTRLPGEKLRLARLDDYLDPIVKRNLFAPYVPPPPSAPAPSRRERPAVAERRESPLDAAQYAFVTGFTEVDGARKVWIQDRIEGKVWMLDEGDEFHIGRLRGSVLSISPAREVVLDFDGQRRRFRDGDNLRGGNAVESNGEQKD